MNTVDANSVARTGDAAKAALVGDAAKDVLVGDAAKAALVGDAAGGTPAGALATVGETAAAGPASKKTAAAGPVRGYTKLSNAYDAFHFDFRNKTVLDIGSSTGGFTEFALERGAKKVIAVEKGSHQMKAPLRFDPRIELHEKTDIFDVYGTTRDESLPNYARRHERVASEPHNDGRERSEFGNGLIRIEAPDVIVADVSFVSLKSVLKHTKDHLANRNTEFLIMLKPQFEARKDQLNRGIVKNEKIRRDIIKNFEQWLRQNNFVIINKRDNALHGRHGNIERFYLLKMQTNKFFKH